jgi:hypothetical protein
MRSASEKWSGQRHYEHPHIGETPVSLPPWSSDGLKSIRPYADAFTEGRDQRTTLAARTEHTQLPRNVARAKGVISP